MILYVILGIDKPSSIISSAGGVLSDPLLLVPCSWLKWGFKDFFSPE